MDYVTNDVPHLQVLSRRPRSNSPIAQFELRRWPAIGRDAVMAVSREILTLLILNSKPSGATAPGYSTMHIFGRGHSVSQLIGD
jgi:hypothetical protein